MTDTNVFQLSQPGNFADPLTEVLRKGARALLAQAVEAEVATLFSRYADETTDVVVYAGRPVGGLGDTVSLIIRRLGNRLRREHLLRYCDQLPIFLEEALSRR